MKTKITQEIKERLTMQDVLNKYIGYDSRKKRIPCPFHNGKNSNFAFNNDRFICFKCGAKGDIFSFVSMYCDVPFNKAVEILNDDFNLGLMGKKLSYRDRQRAIKERKEREAKRQAYEAEKKRLDDNYWKAFEEWIALDVQKRTYAPKSSDEEWQPLFVEALQKIGIAEYKLDIAERERWDFIRSAKK